MLNFICMILSLLPILADSGSSDIVKDSKHLMSEQEKAHQKKEAEKGIFDLKKGNAEYASEQDREACEVKPQTPFCAILSCSDARVPPEIILGQSVGDLFQARVAGNVVTPATQESLAYAIYELKVPLVIVMGHQDCGAVTGVITGKLNSGVLARGIRRAIKKEKDVNKAIKLNAIYQTELLRRAFSDADVTFVSAYYDMDQCKFVVLDAKDPR